MPRGSRTPRWTSWGACRERPADPRHRPGHERDQMRAGGRGRPHRRARPGAARPDASRAGLGRAGRRGDLGSVQARCAPACDGQDARDVVAVGHSNQRETLGAWDAAQRRAACTGAELAGSAHRRRSATALRDRAVKRAGARPQRPAARPDVFRRQGDSGCWMRSIPTGRAARAGEIRLGTIDSWLLSRFSAAEPLIEAGNASRTQLLGVLAGAWDERSAGAVRRAGGGAAARGGFDRAVPGGARPAAAAGRACRCAR